MNTLGSYDINWKGLSTGTHRFDFEADDAFFAMWEDSPVRGGMVSAGVDLTRSASMLRLAVKITGTVVVECDRCLGDLELPVDYDGVLTVKFSDETDEYDGEVMWISPSQDTISLAQYIYESVVLGLPYRRVHGTDAEGRPLCDEDMLSRFSIISEEEFERIEHDTAKLSESPGSEDLARLKDALEKEENRNNQK